MYKIVAQTFGTNKTWRVKEQETQRREEETFSHDTPAPAHTALSGILILLTSSQQRSGPGMKRERHRTV